MELGQQPHQLPKGQGGLAPVHPRFNPIPFFSPPKQIIPSQSWMSLHFLSYLTIGSIESCCQETLLRSDVGDLRKGSRSTLRLRQVITLTSISHFPRRYLEPEPQGLFLFWGSTSDCGLLSGRSEGKLLIWRWPIRFSGDASRMSCTVVVERCWKEEQV